MNTQLAADAATTELVPVEATTTALAPIVPIEDLYAEYAGLGNENVGATDKQTAFVQILQSNSPQVTLGNAKYNDNARAGMITNTVTGKLADGTKVGIIGIPVYFYSEVIEWAPRDSAQKGLKGRHKITDAIFVKAVRNEKGVLVAENGNELRETAYHGFLQYDPATGEMVKVIIPFSSTELKKSKGWNTQIDNQKVPGKPTLAMPRFGQIYKLTVVPENNAKGNWLGWKIELIDFVKDATLLKAAKAYYDELTASGIKNVPNEEHGDPGSSAGAGSSNTAPAQDDVPF